MSDDLLPSRAAAPPKKRRPLRGAILGASALIAGVLAVGTVSTAQTDAADAPSELRAQADALDANAAEQQAIADELRALADELEAPPPTTAPPTSSTSSSTTTTTSPPAPPSDTLHGAYLGVSGWPGPLEIVDLHVGQSSWAGQTSSIGSWRTDLPVKANIGLWPKGLGSGLWSRVTSGEWDDEVEANARAIRDRTDQHVYLALGHEANDGAVQPWGFDTSSEVAAYKVAWEREAAIYRRILGSQVTLMPCWGLWNVTLGNLRTWTPPSAELVCIDVYDRAGGFSGTPAQRWAFRHEPGMSALAAYAIERGQRTFIGEWALAVPAPPGGGDNPYFVHRVFDWMEATRTVADAWHQSDRSSGGSADHALQRFPQSEDAYLERVAG